MTIVVNLGNPRMCQVPLDEGRRTRLTLICQTDTRNWIPKFLINMKVAEVLSDYVRSAEQMAIRHIAQGTMAELERKAGLGDFSKAVDGSDSGEVKVNTPQHQELWVFFMRLSLLMHERTYFYVTNVIPHNGVANINNEQRTLQRITVFPIILLSHSQCSHVSSWINIECSDTNDKHTIKISLLFRYSVYITAHMYSNMVKLKPSLIDLAVDGTCFSHWRCKNDGIQYSNTCSEYALYHVLSALTKVLWSQLTLPHSANVLNESRIAYCMLRLPDYTYAYSNTKYEIDPLRYCTCAVSITNWSVLIKNELSRAWQANWRKHGMRSKIRHDMSNDWVLGPRSESNCGFRGRTAVQRDGKQMLCHNPWLVSCMYFV